MILIIHSYYDSNNVNGIEGLGFEKSWSRYYYYVGCKIKYCMKPSYFIFPLVVQYIEDSDNDYGDGYKYPSLMPINKKIETW